MAIGTLLTALPTWALLLGLAAAGLALGFIGAPLWAWLLAGAALLLGLGAPLWLWVLAAIPALVLGIPQLRTLLVSRYVLRALRAMSLLPKISETERTALEAGTVWVDGELFSGKPDFAKLLSEPYPGLTPDEQAFLDGPVEVVCKAVDDWQVWQQRDLPPQVWDLLGRERFFGMIIPKAYGGLEFSASANSAVVAKLASRSLPLAVTVMVPNSLGPAELLIHYGTDEQKRHYLPRLATGEEIPCFALTEPGAGSDAGAIQADGEVFRDDAGRLMIRLHWEKRWITLAAISTVLGLAFKLRDPENLLGKGTYPGITCALIPTDTPGVEVGHRHDPLGVPFYNCPTEGHGVVVPVDAIIGGAGGAGRGWAMLMDCLSAGRGISLPATSTGGAKLVARATSAHAAVRKQFGLPIGRFEGVEEPLARIAGYTYVMEAARRYTNGGLDAGAKPAVVTAIAKYNFTELFRQIVNDGMDIAGGAGISRGPRNLLAHPYIGTPISITVEGANILTRTLMVFGQGAIRCHPYAVREIAALESGDARAFDRAFAGHVGHVVRNATRALLLSVTRGHLARSPIDGPGADYVRKLSWASASFAFLADVAMASLGGQLKRKEKLTGRFADVFSWLYLATATLRRFEAEGRRLEDAPLFHWAMQHALHRMQVAFDGILENLDVPGLGWALRGPVALWSRVNRLATPPSDRLGSDAARALLVPGPAREGLTAGIHLPADHRTQQLARLDRAMKICAGADEILGRIKDAVRRGKLPAGKPAARVEEAIEAGVISREDAELLADAEAVRADAIAVDAFSLDDYLRTADRGGAQAHGTQPHGASSRGSSGSTGGPGHAG